MEYSKEAQDKLYESCKELITSLQILIQDNTNVLSHRSIMSVAKVADKSLRAIAKAEGKS